jgi:hypothetical protein
MFEEAGAKVEWGVEQAAYGTTVQLSFVAVNEL